MPSAAELFQFSTPTPLPDGRSWTAEFISEDYFRLFEVYFDVTVHNLDGTTVVFPATIPSTGDNEWDQEPSRAQRDLDRVVRDQLGIAWGA